MKEKRYTVLEALEKAFETIEKNDLTSFNKWLKLADKLNKQNRF